MSSRGLARLLDATELVTTRTRNILVLLGLLYAALVILLIVFGDRPVQRIIPFVASQDLAVAIVAGITSMLLYQQAAVSGRRAYLVLGATYQASAMLELVSPLVFPDALRPGRVLGGLDSPFALKAVWHLTFTVGILVAAVLNHRDETSLRRPGLSKSVAVWVAGTAVLCAIPISAALWFPGMLPPVMRDETGGSSLMLVVDVAAVLIALVTCAVTLRYARRGSLISMFLAGVGVFLLGFMLVKLGNADRWTVGWYGNRLLGLVTMTVLLVLLIWALSRIDLETAREIRTDSVTGVMSRGHFNRSLAFELQRLRVHGGIGLLLWIDLDAFKSTNDRLGHQGGDVVLEQVGSRLRASSRENDLVGRVGGDEFALLCTDLVDPVEGMDRAERLRVALRRVYLVDGASVLLSASIGAVIVRGEIPDETALLRSADLAMMAAKSAGGDQVAVFDPQMESHASRWAANRAELAQALRNGDFDLDYQPIVRPATGEIVGVEALARWIRGDVRASASQFIPTMEATGQIMDLGRQLLGILVRDAALLLQELPDDGFICVNMSTTELGDAEHRSMLLDEPLVSMSRRIIVEVTETANLVPGSPAARAVEHLQLAGYALAIDDFGTGYSNFDRLESARPTMLKLDRSLVSRAGRGDQPAADFLEAAARIGHAIGAQVLVEGVETRTELELAVGLGADLVQGWYFARAVPHSELSELLARNRGDVGSLPGQSPPPPGCEAVTGSARIPAATREVPGQAK